MSEVHFADTVDSHGTHDTQASYEASAHHHNGNDISDDHKHVYGYDSIDVSEEIATDPTDAGTENQLVFSSIKTRVEEANQERVDHLTSIRDKHERRLLEIKEQNDDMIKAPFEF